MDSQSKSPLLALPPEMRNRIYRACLVEGEYTIRSNAIDLPKEPALLCTCRQIREEAIDIYYEENQFKFVIVNHNAGNYFKWCRSAERRSDCNIVFSLIDYSSNWPNLEKWLEACWTGESNMRMPSASYRNENLKDTPVRNAATHVFSVLEAVPSNMSWEAVRLVLRNVRKALGVENAKWLEEATDLQQETTTEWITSMEDAKDKPTGRRCFMYLRL